jgi:hypothetical protein
MKPNETWVSCSNVVPLGCVLFAKCGSLTVCPEVCARPGWPRLANLCVPYEPHLMQYTTFVEGLLFAMYRQCPRVDWASMYLVKRLKITGQRGLQDDETDTMDGMFVFILQSITLGCVRASSRG